MFSSFLLKVAIGDNSGNGMIEVYDAINFELIFTFQAHTNTINQIKQLPNGYVVTTSQDIKIKIWNPSLSSSCWPLIQTYTGHSIDVLTVEYINTDTLASASMDDGDIKIWSISTGLTSKIIHPGTNIWSIKLLSNGYHLAAGLNSQNINIYDINTGNLVSTLSSRTTNGNADADLALINIELLAAASTDNYVRIFNLTTNTIKFNLSGHTDRVMKLKLVSSDILASGSLDKTVKLWNTTTGTLIRTLSCHTNQIWYAVDFLNDGQTLVSGSLDQTIKLWNFNTGECLNTINAGLSIKSLAVLNSSVARSNFYLKR